MWFAERPSFGRFIHASNMPLHGGRGLLAQYAAWNLTTVPPRQQQDYSPRTPARAATANDAPNRPPDRPHARPPARTSRITHRHDAVCPDPFLIEAPQHRYNVVLLPLSVLLFRHIAGMHCGHDAATTASRPLTKSPSTRGLFLSQSRPPSRPSIFDASEASLCREQA